MNEILLQIKINSDLKDELKREAKEKGLTLASYVRMILIERGK